MSRGVRAGAARGSARRGEDVCSRESREVGLQGTGSDGESLAPVSGKTQAEKCGHTSRGVCVKSVTVLQPLPSKNEGGDGEIEPLDQEGGADRKSVV